MIKLLAATLIGALLGAVAVYLGVWLWLIRRFHGRRQL